MKEYLVSYREGQSSIVKMMQSVSEINLNKMISDSCIKVRWIAESYDSEMDLDMELRYSDSLYDRVERVREEYYKSDEWLIEKDCVLNEAKMYCYDHVSDGYRDKHESVRVVYERMIVGVMSAEIGLLNLYVSKVSRIGKELGDWNRNVKFKKYK